MKLVIGIVRPEKANDVLEALYKCEVSGLSISRVQGHGGELDQVQTYRGTTVKMELSDKVRFDIAVSDDFVDPTITALCEGARTGEVGDGKIFVIPLERAVRIRTGETDKAAVTPVGCLMPETINTGDTAWMLMATALVMLMTIGLGLFYAGLVRAKNSLNTFMMCIAALGGRDRLVVAGRATRSRSATAAGSSATSTTSLLKDVGLRAVRRADRAAPRLLRLPGRRFCIITAALVSGAVVERMRFLPYLGFIAIWSIVVYPVMAHWVFGGGFLPGERHARLRRRRAGRDGLGLLRARRRARRRQAHGLRPPRASPAAQHAVFVLLGAGILWFGWFGFNGGSGIGIGQNSVLAFTNTLLTPAVCLADVVRARPDPWPAGDGGRRGHGDHRRLRRHHAGRRLHQPGLGDGARRDRRDPVLPADRAGGRARAWTRRSTCSPRTAWRASPASCSSASSRRRSWNGDLGEGLFYGDSALLGDQALAALVAPLYAFVATFVLLKLMSLAFRCG